MDKTKEIVITAVVTLVIVGLIGGFITSFLTSPEPVLYLEDPCFYSFNKDKEQDFSIRLQNMGEATSLATLCASSKEFVFISKSGDILKQVCSPEYKVYPKQTDLFTIYTITAKPDANIFDSIETATIKIDISCRQKIWSIYPKKCDGITKFCEYKKDQDKLIKVE